ncbi:hypothetical protein E8E11_003804 [Didymella keratinophila]|nr:hypothetical protein E8E11_003804 [Didymella keratinophila]
MAIVEVGMMGVQTGKTPMDPTTPDGRLLHDAWTSVIAAPGGPARVYWGTEVENPSKIWGFFDWESLEQHEAFAKSLGGEATKRFGEVFTPGFTKHALLDTHVLKAPVTEVMLASFPPDFFATQKDDVMRRFQDFQSSALDHCADVRGVSGGWGPENDFPLHHVSTIEELNDGDKQKTGCLFFVLTGWGSVGENRVFRETKQFREYIQLLAEVEGCIALSTMLLRCEILERLD